MVGFHLRTLAQLDARARRAYLKVRVARVLDRIVMTTRGRSGLGSTEFTRRDAFREALDAYQPARYDSRVVLLHGAKLPWGVHPAWNLRWRNLVDALEVAELPAYFGTSLLEPTVRLLAEKLDRLMDGSAVR
jgi:hypothetical protein